MLMILLVAVCSLASLVVAIGSFLLKQTVRKLKKNQKKSDDRLSIGIFHPYCDAGGGGERVLWCAIKCLQLRYSGHRFVVYTGDVSVAPDDIVANAKKRFDIEFPEKIEFIYLHRRKWVEAKKYSYFTLLGQSIGSVYLSLEALCKFVPDVYIDTTGYAFSVPVFKFLGGCRVGSYVHYPTISTDMLNRVSSRVETYNNRSSVTRSPFLTSMKLLYYKVFAKLYAWAGRRNNIVMVNSSWTEDHINQIWQSPSRTFKVYPPCDVEDFKNIPFIEDGQKQLLKIVSVAQFRPEKDHPLQIRMLFNLRQIMKEPDWERVRLVLIGSCRNQEDHNRVKDMQDLCKHLSVEENVIFKINVSYEELKQELSEGIIGIHTMWNEHFGIGVVECMAAGLIMVANRSGGPMMDIVMEYDGSRNGFLATDENDYAWAIQTILSMTPEARAAIRQRAKASVDRFSDRQFAKEFLKATESLFA
ncbi:unnamed protein product [Allacma fusca]|uniref:GDP-Man:Man(3)GlcNAc(2)-PP-Dol alpha-1,2-mannosyltransferase n=1 Tax=Allacma fusca TaxID=39272 RepID=A0A8J2KFB0_9HEXA|nr:unnamed protein product [Allacma fusca]